MKPNERENIRITSGCLCTPCPFGARLAIYINIKKQDCMDLYTLTSSTTIAIGD